jgi:hypothetical protein
MTAELPNRYGYYINIWRLLKVLWFFLFYTHLIIKVIKIKKLLLASTITGLYLSSVVVTTQAHAEDMALSLCQYVAADDNRRLRSFIKSNRINIRSVFKDLKCNGKNLLEFAASKGSLKTGELLISKLPKSTVSKNLAAIQTGTPLFDAANKRVNS